MYFATNRARSLAKSFRRKATRHEQKVWRWLRDRRFTHLKFRRQYPIGPYIADFYCASLKLVIELDGSWHGGRHDAERTARLRSIGTTVLRIPNRSIDDDPTSAADLIYQTVLKLSGVLPPD